MVSPGAEPGPGLVTSIHDAGLEPGLPRRPAPTQLGRLSVLRPYLPRPAPVNQSTDDLKVAGDLTYEALHQFRHGVLVVEGGARVLFANRAAERILTAPRGALRIECRRLTAPRRADSAALTRLLATAVRNGAEGSLVISCEGHPTLIVLVPARAAADVLRHPGHAIVFIKHLEELPRRSSSAFARYFALTPAQAALADELARGDGVGAAARRLRISYGTARAHLLQIFQKTGVRRQTGLIRLILEWDAGIGQMADATPGDSP